MKFWLVLKSTHYCTYHGKKQYEEFSKFLQNSPKVPCQHNLTIKMKPSTVGKSKKSVPDFVSQQYYRIGLLCASRPRPVLFIAVVTVIYACWPLLSIPIYIGRPASHVETLDSQGQIVPKFNFSEEIPAWKSREPEAYVQQIIVKSMVHPYKKEELIKTDAFRGPLASAFKVKIDWYIRYIYIYLFHYSHNYSTLS